MNLFSDSAREYRLKTYSYTLYVLHTMRIVRGVQISDA